MESIHRPLLCTCSQPIRPYRTSILRVHHYIGTWEQYAARPDIRRSRSVYDNFAYVDDGVSFELQNWLRRFIDTVGVDKSHLLLKSAGVVVTGSIPIMELNPHVLLQTPTKISPDEMIQCMIYYYYDSKK